jgi:prevent-host-death family protein
MERPLRIGLREANQKFSRAMKAVKAGREVVLTERGKAIAVIKPLARASGSDQVIRELEAAGVLQAATRRGPMPPWRPRRLRGAPISRTLEEERNSR